MCIGTGNGPPTLPSRKEGKKQRGKGSMKELGEKGGGGGTLFSPSSDPSSRREASSLSKERRAKLHTETEIIREKGKKRRALRGIPLIWERRGEKVTRLKGPTAILRGGSEGNNLLRKFYSGSIGEIRVFGTVKSQGHKREGNGSHRGENN